MSENNSNTEIDKQLKKVIRGTPDGCEVVKEPTKDVKESRGAGDTPDAHAEVPEGSVQHVDGTGDCKKVDEVGDARDASADASKESVEDRKGIVAGADKGHVNGAIDVKKLEEKVATQIEYYFGNMNLSRDKFLQEQIKLDDGWVSLDVMLKFNRLRTLTEDKAVIVSALKSSPKGLVAVSEDETKIRRSPDIPLPENTKEWRDSLKSRSVYAKGFPLDAKLEDVQTFVSGFGPTEQITMRRNMEKKFKGSVFMTFEKKEDADKFVGAADVKYLENDLLRLFKDAYYTKKQVERAQKKAEVAMKFEEEKKLIEKQQVEEKMQKGIVIHMSGFSSDSSRESIRDLLEEHGKVNFIDYSRGDKEGWVRFDESVSAAEVLRKLRESCEGKIEMKGAELDCRVLEGDEEIAYWKKKFEAQAESRQKKKQKGKYGQRTRGGRQNRDNRRGKKGSPGKAQNKKKKFDDSDESDSESDDDAEDAPSGGAKRPAEETNADKHTSEKCAKTADDA